MDGTGVFKAGTRNNRAHGQGEVSCAVLETSQRSLGREPFGCGSVASFPQGWPSCLSTSVTPLAGNKNPELYVCGTCRLPGEVLRKGFLSRQLSLFAIVKLIPSPQAELRRIPDLSQL